MVRLRRSDQTSAVLRREIKGGRFRGVSILPGERQLASSLQVSRTTLRRALADLIEEGLLSQRHGMGTFVIDPRDEPTVEAHIRPVVYYGLNGRVDRIEEVSRGCSDADAQEVMGFGIEPAEDVFRLTRRLFVKERADAVEHWSLPSLTLPGSAPFTASLSSMIAACPEQPVKKLRRLRLGVLSEADAALLDALPESAAMSVHDAFFTAAGRCCLRVEAFYPAARLDAVWSLPVGPDAIV